MAKIRCIASWGNLCVDHNYNTFDLINLETWGSPMILENVDLTTFKWCSNLVFSGTLQWFQNLRSAWGRWRAWGRWWWFQWRRRSCPGDLPSSSDGRGRQGIVVACGCGTWRDASRRCCWTWHRYDGPRNGRAGTEW